MAPLSGVLALLSGVLALLSGVMASLLGVVAPLSGVLISFLCSFDVDFDSSVIIYRGFNML